MHGLTDSQFFEKVASFLGPYYVALAVMNGLAAFYLWRSGQLQTWLHLPLPGTGKKLAINNAQIWLAVAAVSKARYSLWIKVCVAQRLGQFEYREVVFSNRRKVQSPARLQRPFPLGCDVRTDHASPCLREQLV